MSSRFRVFFSVFGISCLIFIGLISVGHTDFEKDAKIHPGPTQVSGPDSASTSSLDGASLYSGYCSGCHDQSKRGVAASKIQSAIDNNIGGMGFLSSLTPAEVEAISKY